MNHPYVQDLLWAYQRKGSTIHFPAVVTFGDRRVDIDMATHGDDMDPRRIIKTEKLSRVQRELMFESLNCLYEVSAAYGTTVIHVFTSTLPDWYAQEVTGLIRDSAKFQQCQPVVVGPIPFRVISIVIKAAGKTGIVVAALKIFFDVEYPLVHQVRITGRRAAR